MVAAGGEKGRRVAETLGEFEAQDARVEVEGALEVCDLEVDVADSGFGMDGRCRHGGF
jgi:hypothetical protein